MYVITKITDKQGNDRNDGRYPLRIGRKCKIHFDTFYKGIPVAIEKN